MDVKTQIDELVKNGLKALDELHDFNQEQIDYIVAKMSVAGLDHHGNLAKFAIEETGIDMNLCSIIPNEEEFMAKVEELSYLAYEDQCTPANPREPLVSDMIQILKDAYKDN